MNHLSIFYSSHFSASEIKTRKIKMKFSLTVLLLGPVFFIVLFFGPGFFSITTSFPVYGRFTEKEREAIHMVHRPIDTTCRNMQNNSICCDRTNYHTDICFMQGDVRSHASSSSIVLFSKNGGCSSNSLIVEKIRPYTRKWETSIMNHIPELSLRFSDPNNLNSSYSMKKCDVKHNVTALFFSIGGYTGNIFHSFSNGIIPLYITSQHLNRQVVFVVLEYRHWWYDKYQEILSQLSGYPIIDFVNDTRIHCFPSAIIGLQYHNVLSIDPSRMNNNKSIHDFYNMLDKAYKQKHLKAQNPRLVLVARRGSRAIENEKEVVSLAEEIGFSVETLVPVNTMPLRSIHESLSSCDVMIGVHGAGLTHFLFMKPGSLFIQIVPLGLEDLAESCFGNAAKRTGIRYEEYKILPKESSLYWKYGGRDPVVNDPKGVKAKGWNMTKNLYLDGQNVRLDLGRLRMSLEKAYKYAIVRKN